MTEEKSKLSLLVAMFVISTGLLLAGCSEDGAESEVAPADDAMSMDNAEDKIKDGIDPETGNPPEL